MKRSKLFLAVLGIMLFSLQSFAQVSPYQIPPKWMFGYRGGVDFGTSPFTFSPPNILAGNPTNVGCCAPDVVGGLETSSSVCTPASALALYTNQVRYYNGLNASFAFPGGARSSGSSTDGAVIVPDPNNTNQYYLFLANDQTGGPSLGISYYLFNSATDIMTGPTVLLGNIVDESLCSGSDGNGGYWVVAHGNTASPGGYYVWHVTTAGVAQHATFPQTPAGAITQFGNNASMKINRCQDRIAFGTAGQKLEVRSWDRNTGTVGANLFNKTGLPSGIYGLEFSPSGRFVYTGSNGNNNFYQHDINTPASAPVLVSNTNPNSNTGVGTMQLGPDNKVYVTLVSGTGNTGAVYIGVVNTPDVLDLGTGTATGCQFNPQGFTLKPNDGAPYPNILLGIVNEAFMSPETPVITLSAGATCSTVIHTLDFETYFNTDIDLVAATLEWSFDNGSTWAVGTNPVTHDYAGTVTTTARARFYDQTCNNYQWTASVPVSTSCPAPVELLSFNAEKSDNKVFVTWTTSLEINNSHFEVQHSTDGIHFTAIGVVQGNGNSTNPIHYSFTDISPSSGINYYRLIQHDYDGKEHNTRIVSLTIDGLLINVFPNPSTDNFNVTISGTGHAYLIVTDVLGREVYKNTVSENLREFSFGNELPEGSYVIEIITDHEVQTKQVIKQ